MPRLALAAAALLAAATAARAQAVYPYCAVSRGADMIYEECAFASFALCLEEIRGLGGYCRPNARYRGPLPPAEATAPEPRARHLRR